MLTSCLRQRRKLSLREYPSCKTNFHERGPQCYTRFAQWMFARYTNTAIASNIQAAKLARKNSTFIDWPGGVYLLLLLRRCSLSVAISRSLLPLIPPLLSLSVLSRSLSLFCRPPRALLPSRLCLSLLRGKGDGHEENRCRRAAAAGQLCRRCVWSEVE